MQGKKKITPLSVLRNLDAVITGVTLSLCTILVNVNVLMRYFFKSPIFWCEEVVTSLFVWTVFIGSAYAYRKHAHLGVDIIINIMPAKMRSIMRVIMDILECAILVMLTSVSTQYVTNTLDKLTNTLRLPNWYVAIAVPLGFGLSLIYSVYFLSKDTIRAIKNRRKGVTE